MHHATPEGNSPEDQVLRPGDPVAVIDGLHDTGVVKVVNGTFVEVYLDRARRVKSVHIRRVYLIRFRGVLDQREEKGCRYTHKFWMGKHSFKSKGKWQTLSRCRKYELTWDQLISGKGYCEAEQIKFMVNGEKMNI